MVNPQPPFLTPETLDAWLEGELGPGQAAAIEAQVAADPALASRVAGRRTFLAALARGRAAWQAPPAPASLRTRIQDALAAERRAPPPRERVLVSSLPTAPPEAAPTLASGARGLGWLRAPLLAAALLMVVVGATTFFGGTERATALDLAILDAADLSRLETDTAASAGCGDAEAHRVLSFPPVREGHLLVGACDTEGEAVPARVRGGVRARLVRFNELPPVGFVALPADGTEPSHRIGMTDLGDVAVYDLRYGNSTYVLAVPIEPGTARPLEPDCAACHNRSRIGQANPHEVFLRRSP